MALRSLPNSREYFYSLSRGFGSLEITITYDFRASADSASTFHKSQSFPEAVFAQNGGSGDSASNNELLLSSTFL